MQEKVSHEMYVATEQRCCVVTGMSVVSVHLLSVLFKLFCHQCDFCCQSQERIFIHMLKQIYM